jgi:hypothetical protein
VTNDFIVGKLEQIDSKQIIIDSYILFIQPSKQNPQQLFTSMMPMLAPFNDLICKEISVDKFVIMMVNAPAKIEQTYIKLTTGIDIVVPPKTIQ